jgi:hypothetical protein
VNDCIARYDQNIEELGQKKYGHTTLLRQVKGVGPITSLAYVLTLEDPQRFSSSREVGPYLGLVPKQEDSGDSQPQLGISKTGDRMLRRLLVGSSQYMLGVFGPDTDLRRYGLRLCERGGKNAKKRAVVAVARKLAVLLHHLWVTGDVYQPLHHGSRNQDGTGGCISRTQQCSIKLNRRNREKTETNRNPVNRRSFDHAEADSLSERFAATTSTRLVRVTAGNGQIHRDRQSDGSTQPAWSRRGCDGARFEIEPQRAPSPM